MSKSESVITDVHDGPNTSRLSATLFVCICALPIAATLLFGGVDTISLGLFAIATALMFCIWSFDSVRSGEFRFSKNPLQIPLAAVAVLGFVQLLPLSSSNIPADALTIPASSAITLDPFATKLFTLKIFFFLMFFVLALTCIDSQKRARIVAVLTIIFGSMIAFFGILVRLAQPEAIYGVRPTPQAIPFGPFINQHHFAAFMEMTSGLVFALLLGSGIKRDRKLFLLIAAILMSVALLFTGSRGGLISFVGVIVFVAGATYILNGSVSRDRKIEAASSARSFSILVGGAALLLMAVGLVFYLGGGDSVLRGLGVSNIQTDISSGRIHYWSVAFQIFTAHPILGAGLDAFGNAFTRFDTLSGAFRIEQAHNDYLQMLADGGVIGFLCVAAFVGILFRNGIRNISAAHDPLNRSIATGALAGCFGIAIHSFFDFPLRTPSNALFFLLLAVLATTRFGHRRSRATERGR
jgi:O-antigen ligase